MSNRREFLRLTFGIGAAAVLPASAMAAAPYSTPDGAPWWLVAPLEPGSDLGFGWRVARLFPAADGAVTLNLGNVDGRVARIDLCLHEGAPRGPAHSAFIDFIVMDGGDGARPMDEDLGRAVRRLAAVVAENEARDVGAVATLETHPERVARHRDAMALASRRLRPGVG